jgi:hypothetical protein
MKFLENSTDAASSRLATKAIVPVTSAPILMSGVAMPTGKPEYVKARAEGSHPAASGRGRGIGILRRR